MKVQVEKQKNQYGSREKTSQKEVIGLIIITIILLLIHGIRIFNGSISGDEGFSLRLAKLDVSSMLTATAEDVHPPLYYFLIMYWGKIAGYTAFAGRVLSYLAIIAIAILTNTYIRKRFGASTAAIFFLLLTFTTNCIEMVVEIRMYTWAMVFVTLTALFAYELMRAERAYSKNLKKWIGLSIFGLAAGYTHYYALIMVAFIYIFLFIVLIIKDKKNLLPCFLCGVVAVVVYFPWLLVLLKQFGTVSNDYWISSIEIKDWIRYIFGDDRFGKLLRMILVIVVLIYFITQEGLQISSNLFDKCKNRIQIHIEWKPARIDAERLFVLMCGITTIGTIAVAAIVSYLFRPLYVARYIYSAMGLVALAFGIAYTSCSRKRIYAWILMICIMLFGMKDFVRVQGIEKEYKSEETLDFFAQNLQSNDIIITNDNQLSWTVLEYYFPDATTLPLGSYNLLKEAYHVAWYMNTGDALDERIVAFEQQGLHVTHIMDTGLGRYPYSLYKITK